MVHAGPDGITWALNRISPLCLERPPLSTSPVIRESSRFGQLVPRAVGKQYTLAAIVCTEKRVAADRGKSWEASAPNSWQFRCFAAPESPSTHLEEGVVW